MSMRSLLCGLAVTLSAFVAASPGVVWAQEAKAGESVDAPAATEESSTATAKARWDTDLKTTSHTVTIDGEQIAYTATAGVMQLLDQDGVATADIYFTAYMRQNVGDVTARPVTFAFNGGPGSSSVWLHMGALGPRRVEFGTEGEPLPPPGTLVDNAFSWLDVTDLVFIDPVSTGFSRALKEEEAKNFHGVEKDISSVGDFIRLYTTRYGRWLSPKFLAGESYGTTRASGLAKYLQTRHGMYLNGIVLVSAVLNFQTLIFNPGNDTPYWLYLPSYTASAWYHQKLAPELQEDLGRTLAEAERWAATEYLLALTKGAALTVPEREEVVRKLARYTGCSETFARNADLRIRTSHFTKELLRDRGMTVGRFDSRYTGRDRNSVEDSYERDPSYSAILGPYAAALNHYLRSELQYENDRFYEILTGRVSPWDFGNAKNSYLNVAESLREAISQNPRLHVLFASGRYDLATPYFATDYTIAHLGLPEELRGNISHEYYEAGHMMYLRLADLEKLKRDVARFMERSLAAE